MEQSAVVYFSCTDNTERIAKLIAEQTNSDIFELEAKSPYTSDDLNWHNMDSRANLEQNDASAHPEITNIPDISAYDTIYLGYPIWWGTIPKIINTFVETGALDGKNIVAFCTSGSTSIETSVFALENYKLDVIDSRRFSESATEDEVKNWLNEK